MKPNESNKNNLFRVKSKNGVLRCLKAGVDINICNDKGQTALFTCNVPEAIQAMIDADIDIHHLGRVRISTLRNENETFSQLNSITYIGVFCVW